LDPAVVRRGIYRMHHRLIWEGAEEFTQPAHARTHGAKRPAKPHGRGPRPTFVTPASPRPTGIALPLEPQSAPANVRVNDPTGDGSQMVQAELSIAAAGITAILSWNDSKGFTTGGAVQGIGSSASNGQTWTDRGDPPVPATGWAMFRWRGD